MDNKPLQLRQIVFQKTEDDKTIAPDRKKVLPGALVNRVRVRLCFLFLAVVDVVALGGLHLGEVGEVVVREDVVPLDELLHVGGIDAVAVEVG